MSKGESRIRTVRMPHQLDRALDAYCKKHGVEPSDTIRTAVAKYIGAPAEAAEKPPQGFAAMGQRRRRKISRDAAGERWGDGAGN